MPLTFKTILSAEDVGVVMKVSSLQMQTPRAKLAFEDGGFATHHLTQSAGSRAAVFRIATAELLLSAVSVSRCLDQGANDGIVSL